MKEDYQKTLKKLTLFFLSNPVPFNGQSYQKQKGPGTSDQSLFRLQNKFRKIPLLVMYYLTKFDDVIYIGFWVIPKIISANLCKPIYDIINYSTSIYPFESGKFGKEEKKWQKFEYLENEKSFFDEIKKIFHSFLRAIMWWKNKNLTKIRPPSQLFFLHFITNIFQNMCRWLLLFIKPGKMKSTVIPVFIFVINFRNETAR